MAVSTEETGGYLDHYSGCEINHSAEPPHWEPGSSATSACNLQGHYLSELLLFASVK